MDILNFISWTKNGRTVSTVDASQTLLPVGLKDPKRDDGYLAGAISVADFLALSILTLFSYEILYFDLKDCATYETYFNI